MIKTLLSILLHHANRNTSRKEFYAIKDFLLQRYGTLIGHDLQFIYGKSCYSCDGTGVYKHYGRHNGQVVLEEWCYDCGGTGLYKRHLYIILKRIKFGKYYFHTPMKRYETTEILVDLKPQINGYVLHEHSRYGETAMIILFLLFNPAYLLRSDICEGWYVYWYLPRNWAGTFLRIAYRISKIKMAMEKL